MKRLLCLAWLCAAACGGTNPDALVPTPTLGTPIQVVPSATLPVEYQQVSGMSNNNLDVVVHDDGAVYLALRTSADHFASTASRIVVLRSTDQTTWTWEATFSTNSDAREPRLLSFKGRLFLYFAQLGSDPGKFEPQGMFMTERTTTGWTTPAKFYHPEDNYIPWRSKVRNGRAWMTAYRGGEHIYDLSGMPIDVALLVSDDGVTWAPENPSIPFVTTGGGSETDFDFDANGDLYAIVRNEAGDETGWGSKICKASKSSLSKWTCKHDSKKYDSPLVFAYDADSILLIGRRNVTETGNYEQNPGVAWNVIETLSNLTNYSLAPKRCALWQIDRHTLQVRFMLDIPGHGDTCFASKIQIGNDPRQLTVYNYSSPLEGDPNIDWPTGQLGETRIYRVDMSFPIVN